MGCEMLADSIREALEVQDAPDIDLAVLQSIELLPMVDPHCYRLAAFLLGFGEAAAAEDATHAVTGKGEVAFSLEVFGKGNSYKVCLLSLSFNQVLEIRGGGEGSSEGTGDVL